MNINKDILGNKELEALTLNWDFIGPGLMDGRCLATGTCDSPTTNTKKKNQKFHVIFFSEDGRNANEIKMRYSDLRF